MHPFQNGPHADIMMMAASAGLLGGDHFKLKLEFGKNSDATFLSQSYEKIFDSNGKKTLKNVNITVKENAYVEYKPYPAIPFAKSHFENTTEVHLAKSATFSFIDIFSCGRTGMGEAFQMKSYRSRAKFYVEDKLVFADHTLIDPQKWDYYRLGFWQGYTHNGMLFFYTPEGSLLSILQEKIRTFAKSFQGSIGVSSLSQGILVRALSMRGETIWNFFEKLNLRQS